LSRPVVADFDVDAEPVSHLSAHASGDFCELIPSVSEVTAAAASETDRCVRCPRNGLGHRCVSDHQRRDHHDKSTASFVVHVKPQEQ
jgi:hypothetical protein